MYPALLLLHGNNLDESLYLGGAILLYLLFLFVRSHQKTKRLKREKALRKAERAARNATASSANASPPTDKTSKLE